jgi:hypothetical protein
MVGNEKKCEPIIFQIIYLSIISWVKVLVPYFFTKIIPNTREHLPKGKVQYSWLPHKGSLLCNKGK